MCRFGTYPCDFVRIPRQLFTPNVNSARPRRTHSMWDFGVELYSSNSPLKSLISEGFFIYFRSDFELNFLDMYF